jgi:microcystin-dependent protein
MENLYVILILVIILLAIFIENNKENKDNKENLDSTQSSLNLSNEAIQNIASVYNNQNMVVTNLKASGDINFTQFKGIIVAWSGAIADIPKGWGLCDGTKYKALDGTDLQSPDLRSKFIVGASKPGTTLDTSAGTNRPNYPGLWLAPRQVGDQGGEENHTLSIAEIPSHTHATLGVTNYGGGGLTGGVRLGDWGSWTANAAFNTGGGGPHNNMPPFYALAYIIKL